jgi:hypothetical protein
MDDLTEPQLDALRFYRKTFDQSEQSLTKSALDIRPRGAGGIESALERMETIITGWQTLHLIERKMPGDQVQVLHAIALQDMGFKQLAIVRYGGRPVERVETSGDKPHLVTTIEPRSGRHRQLVRDQFMLAVASLVEAVRPFMTTAANDHVPAILQAPPPVSAELGPAGPAPIPPIDPRFLDDRGILRPFSEIRDILLEAMAA